MEEWASRFVGNLVGRMHGTMSLRVLVQPAMALFFAIRAGLRDAREHRPPYFWAMIYDTAHRREMLRNGWRDIGRIFFLALILDVIYQAIEFHWLFPGEALIVAALLAIVPYLVFRGLVNRLHRIARGAPRGQSNKHDM